MAYRDEVLADIPWGFWEEVEASGTTLADSSGNSRAMTTTGAPTLHQPGPAATIYSIAFPAASSYAITSATTTTSAATVEAWVYLTALPTGLTAVAGCMSSTTVFDKVLYLDTAGNVGFYVYNGAGRRVISTTPLTLNAWHHLVGSVGAAGQYLRVDKVTVASNATVTTSFTNAQTFHARRALGAMNGGFGTLSGLAPVSIAEPAFYAAQLTDARTDAHYDAMTGTVALSGSGSAQSDASAVVAQAIAGTAAAVGTANAQASASLTATATGSGLGVSSAHAIASVGVDIVPASGAGAGVSAGGADVQRAVTAATDAVAASSATADATSFAQPTGTNKTYRSNGMGLSGSATVDVQPPLEDDPPTLTTVPIHIITPTVPAPTLVNGRPQ